MFELRFKHVFVCEMTKKCGSKSSQYSYLPCSLEKINFEYELDDNEQHKWVCQIQLNMSPSEADEACLLERFNNNNFYLQDSNEYDGKLLYTIYLVIFCI